MILNFDPEHYERVSLITRPINIEALERTTFRRPLNECQQILDVGCGIGDFTRDVLLPRCHPCRNVVGVDISPRMMSHAKKYYAHPGIRYDILDAGSRDDVSEFVDSYGKFDRIYSFYCLHWISDQKATFGNIGTLLRDDGECLLVFCARFVLYDVWLEMSKMQRWKDIVDDPASSFADTWRGDPPPSLQSLVKTVKRLVVDAGMSTISCNIYPTQSDFHNDEDLLAFLVPLVTVKTGTTEEDRDRMREELSVRLLDGCTRTPEGSSYALDLFFVHAQKQSEA